MTTLAHQEHSYGPIHRLMLGGTSTELLHDAPCPVLVLTRCARHDPEAAVATAAGAP
jgi:hypothetical protein